MRLALDVLEKPVALDRDFHAQYAWCLDPFLTLGDQLLRLCEELQGHRTERALNIYLFACSIACTMDDYLGEKVVDLGTRQVQVFARFRRYTKAAAWRKRWTACVDAACLELLGHAGGFEERALPLMEIAAASIGAELLQRRMRIPEGFRCQDLTHHDVIALARQYVAGATPDRNKPLLVIGPRTAGAYFAPLAAADLRTRHQLDATWITVRPKNGLSSSERATIRQAGSFLVIDDHPNSGHTLRLLLGQLETLGVKPASIAAAVPGHPVNPGWTLPDAEARGIHIVVLAPEDRYKVKLLRSTWMSEVLNSSIRESVDTQTINRQFESAYADEFQVRLKRLVDLPAARRVLAKSVGWGWLGYHAFVAAERLEGFVPSSIALREGFLFSDWIEGEPAFKEIASACGCYVARRASTLALKKEPRFGYPELGWCGWNDLTAALRKIYGPYFGRLKQPAIERHLRQLQPLKPVLLDGRMRPDEWVQRHGRVYKTDFEQHNFGGGELDLTDPAWDLASAIFELGLNEGEEAEMLHAYRLESGDAAVTLRLPLYKILCAVATMRASTYWIQKKPGDVRQKQWGERYLAARDFATFQMARAMGQSLAAHKSSWTEKLLFLDLDGVLDWHHLGFPHTTPNGVEALRTLREGGFSIVVNTARSLEHVRQYARCYGLPGGVAELGSVFWDATSEHEIPLIDAPSMEALDRARAELEQIDGVFLDPTHRYSIRAFRSDGERMVRLGDADLEPANMEGLAVLHNSADTHIIAEGAGKGTAVTAVRVLLRRRIGFTAAIGDSYQDVTMLGAVDSAFAPSNASRRVRELAACRIMKRPLQSGLLDAARILAPGVCPVETDSAASFIHALLSVADRSPFERMVSLVRWNKL